MYNNAVSPEVVKTGVKGLKGRDQVYGLAERACRGQRAVGNDSIIVGTCVLDSSKTSALEPFDG